MIADCCCTVHVVWLLVVLLACSGYCVVLLSLLSCFWRCCCCWCCWCCGCSQFHSSGLLSTYRRVHYSPLITARPYPPFIRPLPHSLNSLISCVTHARNPHTTASPVQSSPFPHAAPPPCHLHSPPPRLHTLPSSLTSRRARGNMARCEVLGLFPATVDPLIAFS